jgi:hypothetical protein
MSIDTLESNAASIVWHNYLEERRKAENEEIDNGICGCICADTGVGNTSCGIELFRHIPNGELEHFRYF